jgi:hypothetical protein
MKLSASLAAVLGLMAVANGPASATDDAYRRGDDQGAYANEQPLPWRGSTKDDGYPVPQPPPRAEYEPPRRAQPACLSTVGLRDALNQQGWHAFSDVERRGSVALMSARSDRGRRYDLQVDNCTGDVIEAHPVVVYSEPPPIYYESRPSVGVFIGGPRYDRYGHYGGHRGRW